LINLGRIAIIGGSEEFIFILFYFKMTLTKSFFFFFFFRFTGAPYFSGISTLKLVRFIYIFIFSFEFD